MKKQDFKKLPFKRRTPRNTAKYQMSKDTIIDFKNVALLQKYINDRGKILPRRITGVTASEQRQLCSAIKRARFMALLPSGSVKARSLRIINRE